MFVEYNSKLKKKLFNVNLDKATAIPINQGRTIAQPSMSTTPVRCKRGLDDAAETQEQAPSVNVEAKEVSMETTGGSNEVKRSKTDATSGNSCVMFRKSDVAFSWGGHVCA